MTPKMPAKKVKLRGTSVNLKPMPKGVSVKSAQPPKIAPVEHAGASFDSAAPMPPPPPGIQLKSATLRFPNGSSPQPGVLASLAPATGQVRFQPGVISSPEQIQEREELLDLIGSRQSAATGPIQRSELGYPSPFDRQEEAFDSMDVSFVSGSLQDYLDICEASLRPWTPLSLIDSAHIFVKSLGLDVLSLAVVDPDRPGKLLPVVSRGYNTPPTSELSAIWESSIGKDGGVDWKSLMDSTSRPDAPFAAWIMHEGLGKFGYAPIHDGKLIYGFLVIGSFDKSRISPIAAPFLEMLGGRLGLSLGLQRNRGEWPASVLKTVRTLRDCLSLQLGVVEMLRESSKLSPEELNSLLDSGTQSLSEAASLLDRLVEEAAGSKPGS